MKKILILVSILFTVGISNVTALTTRCKTVTELDPYELWWGREVPITKTTCYTDEPTPPSANEYSQNRCNREFPGTMYNSNTDWCYCQTGDYDHSLRKCVDKNVMCNEKYPGTQYQSAGDKCVCPNNGDEYIESMKMCGKPSQYKCKLDDGTMVPIGFVTAQRKICNADGTLSCQGKGIWDATVGYCMTISECGENSGGVNGVCDCKIGYEWDGIMNGRADCKEINLEMLTPDQLTIKKYQAMALKLSSEGIINPQTNPKDFNVSSPILRQELIGIALKLKQIQLPDNYNCKNIFSDVSKSMPNTWVCRAAEFAAQNGIITKDNTKFNPQNNVSITEGLAMIFNSLELDFSSEDSSNSIFYSTIQEWQKPILSLAQRIGFINNTNIDPNKIATRGDIFYAILRVRMILDVIRILDENQ